MNTNNNQKDGAPPNFADLIGQKAMLEVEGIEKPLEITVTGIRIHETLPPNHPVYGLIGRVASDWAIYEHYLDLCIWALAGLRPSTGASITAQIMGAGNRLVTIRTLAGERGVIDGISDELKRLEKATFSPQERRNRVIHDHWSLERVSNSLEQHRSMPKKEPTFGYVPISTNSLSGLIGEISQLTMQANQLHQIIRRALEALAKQGASPDKLPGQSPGDHQE